MTIGDVLAALAAAALVAGSWVALLVLAAFVCSRRVEGAAARIEEEPLRCAGRGLVVVACGLFLVLATAHRFVGPARLLPLLVVAALLAASVIGGAGIVRLIARRSGNGSELNATVKAAGLYTLAGLCPICGW